MAMPQNMRIRQEKLHKAFDYGVHIKASYVLYLRSSIKEARVGILGRSHKKMAKVLGS